MDSRYTTSTMTTCQSAGTSRHPDLPPGTPEWITPEKIRETQRVWQPHSHEPVTVEVAIEMLINVRRLGEWMNSAPLPRPPPEP